nr:hypothetical protein [Tanacetum cinerariifolium]
MSNTLDASLVDTESSETESKEQDTSSGSWNDAHADDTDIKPKYDEEPMAEEQLIADHNVFPTGQQYSEQHEFNNEGEMVNTRTDAELAAAVQNALQTLLPQIREEFYTGSGPSGSGGNPPPVTIHTWLERFN